MTTQTITGPELSAWIAENVMGWKGKGLDYVYPIWISGGKQREGIWRPHSDRNDLAEVLAKVPRNKRDAVLDAIRAGWAKTQPDRVPCWAWEWFLLTADPLVVCKAIWEVMRDD